MAAPFPTIFHIYDVQHLRLRLWGWTLYSLIAIMGNRAYNREMSKEGSTKQVLFTGTEGNKRLSCLTKVGRKCLRSFAEVHISHLQVSELATSTSFLSAITSFWINNRHCQETFPCGLVFIFRVFTLPK